MAKTTPANVDSSIREVWAKQVLRTKEKKSFFAGLMGPEGSGAPIIRKTELLGRSGDLIHIQVTDPLTGSGVQGDTTALEGSEENLVTSEIKCQPDLFRHAVRVYRRANKKSDLDLREEAKMRLAEHAAKRQDSLCFTNFKATSLTVPAGETYTPNVYVVGGGADEDAVAAGDTLTVESLQEIALTLDINDAQPLNIDGSPHYGLVIHPYATHQLKQEARYESWVREAAVRGKDNPFFRGALAVIDGMILYPHVRCGVAANATAVQYSNGIAFGAEAFVMAEDEDITWVEDLFDYENEWGVAYSYAMQPRRALESSSLQVFAAAPTV